MPEVAPDGARPVGVLVGPLLRHVDATSATVWVETDAAREVTLRAGGQQTSEATWSLHGHHYALLVLTGLEPGVTHPYDVLLDGEVAWPPKDALAPSVIRTVRPESELRVTFGSCRVSRPDDAAGLKQYGADALVALAERMLGAPTQEWPDLLFMAGDQVYADNPSEPLANRLRDRHAGDPENARGSDNRLKEIHDFEEYTWLYRESWTPPAVRWLLSTVPSCMLLDDHDLRDDWNSSRSWRDAIRTEPWWEARVRGAFASYWVYQHLGNLSPRELGGDELFANVRAAGSDAERERLVDDFAARSDEHPSSARWSYYRDLHTHGGTSVRLIAVDSRCSRRLDPQDRALLDDAEWDWVAGKAREAAGEVDHLLIGTTLPAFLLPGIHDLEGADEAVGAGAWGRGLVGRAASRAAETLRLAIDLEHWAAFRASFDALVALLGEIARAEASPASILLLSGDVHCSYTAQVYLPDADPRRCAVHQLVASPIRNPLNLPIRLANRLLNRRGTRVVTRAIARRAGVADPRGLEWDVDHGPWFDNGVMTVVLRGRQATVEVDHARAVHRHQVLDRTATLPLTR